MNQLKIILPEDIDWKPFAALPSPVRLAVIAGQPSEPGPYMIRVKVPGGVKLMPHRHSEDRIYTVIDGVFYIGVGRRIRRRQTGRVSTRRGDCITRQHVSLSLGKVRRIHHAGHGDWAAGLRIRQLERRSAERECQKVTTCFFRIRPLLVSSVRARSPRALPQRPESKTKTSHLGHRLA